jgi:hypothetical protein
MNEHHRVVTAEGMVPRLHLLPYISGHRDYDLSEERRFAGARQTIANHESPRTTKLYDRTREELSFAEVERIKI